MVASGKLADDTLSLLMSNSRMSLRDIAKKLKVSTTTVSKIVKDMEQRGIIQGYTIRVDWKKVGYDSVLCLSIMTKPDADIDNVGRGLREFPSVKEVFYTTGDQSFSAYVVCRDTDEAATTIKKLSKIEGVERIVSHMVLKAF